MTCDLLLNVLFLVKWGYLCNQLYIGTVFPAEGTLWFFRQECWACSILFFSFQRYVWLWDLLQLHEVSFVVLLLLLFIIIIIIIIIGIIVPQLPNRNIREFPSSHASPFSKHFRTARCASSANSICSELDDFKRQIITITRFSIFICSLLRDAIIIYLSVLVFVLFIFNACFD
jgi:hypothetical protein